MLQLLHILFGLGQPAWPKLAVTPPSRAQLHLCPAAEQAWSLQLSGLPSRMGCLMRYFQTACMNQQMQSEEGTAFRAQGQLPHVECLI